MNPRIAVQGRLVARCRSAQALQEVQAGGLRGTAQWQPLPLLEPQHPALALWEDQSRDLKQQLDPGVGFNRQQANDFRASSDNNGANSNGGGVHLAEIKLITSGYLFISITLAGLVIACAQ